MLLAGCAMRNTPKQAAAAPPPAVKPAAAPVQTPPPQLSTPQTKVALPADQPVSPAALATVPAPAEPAPASSTASRARRTPNTPAPNQAVPAAPVPPAITTPAETREAVQEIISASDARKLLESAQARRREVTQILEQAAKRSMTPAQRSLAASIRSFVALSNEAVKRNDPRQADAMAERAQILARELQSGK
jgi:hypothetical protein